MIVSLAIAVAVITFGLSFEIDRTVERLASSTWPLFQLKLMEWTVLWSLAAVVLFAGVRWIDPAALASSAWRRFAWTIAILLTFKFLILDTTCWLFSTQRATPPPSSTPRYSPPPLSSRCSSRSSGSCGGMRATSATRSAAASRWPLRSSSSGRARWRSVAP